MSDFRRYFARVTGIEAGSYPWQEELAGEPLSSERLIRIPTGFGKTAGVLSAWLWHRVERDDDGWPRRLVWCLPMRVLVEQTADEVRASLRRLALLREGAAPHHGVGVYVLMGGADAGEWHLHPEDCAVLIGTQDMLLSRALNRGYGSPRARWPMEFGLLNHDALWVMDEVQLMDVGLATSGQLHAFRREEGRKAFRPCATWWMSATLQREWLAASPETRGFSETISLTNIAAPARHGHLWEDVEKPVRVVEADGAKSVADTVIAAHLERGKGKDGPTLVVLNRVDDACETFEAIQRDRRLQGTDIRLIHSRFRPHEREAWRREFLDRAFCGRGTDRIIVATQVIEAGVDISATVLVTALAPWTSLVQRFGRAARWGGAADVVIIDPQPADERTAAPYAKSEIDSAREALRHLADVSPAALERFEDAHRDLLPRLYPYAPKHLLLRHEVDDLFDTTPDLSGADVDISRFIRSGEERDLQVFWERVPAGATPEPTLRPARAALCAVPFLRARDWLCGKEAGKQRAPRLLPGVRAWVWSWLDGIWRPAVRRDLYPGQTVLVAADVGGYSATMGWSPRSRATVEPVAPPALSPEELADSSEDDEALSAYPWQTIAVHGQQVGRLAAEFGRTLLPGREHLLDLAGRWHDLGKRHEAFQGSIVGAGRPARRDLAKAPNGAWLPRHQLYPSGGGQRRAGFRHELASTLGMFAVLGRHRQDHPALLGRWRELLEAIGQAPAPAATGEASPSKLELEILDLSEDEFDLVAYLVCAHHGKVRVTWHASAADQRAEDDRLRIRGIRDGDVLPPALLAATDGDFCELPASLLDLAPASVGLNPYTGCGWTERVLSLLERHGPFALAWMEAVLRAADQRASRRPLADPLLESDHEVRGLGTGDSGVAHASGGREAPPALAANSRQRGGEHGVRRGAGESRDAGSGARAPADSTRHVETRLGILSYAELAPHLARQVQVIEEAIEAGELDARPLDAGLVEEVQRRMCADLTPQLAGWRRHDVTVGTHTPPSFVEVPALMDGYGLDLSARLSSLGTRPDLLLETLAFAEGRLLSIHPFADFNGRTTRVLLRLLLRRLDLPAVDLLPASHEVGTYLDALRAADRLDWQSLMAVWRRRFERELQP
ncbi:Fic family protein [bacterium]|nr:Fic family protein [bacterium]